MGGAPAMTDVAATTPSAPVAVVSPLGRVGHVPSDQLAGAFAAGFRVASEDELAAEREREQYGGGAHMLGAGGAGAARALTFGLSDVALAEAGAEEALAAYRRVQPEATMLGEIGGTLAGLGGAAVAKGAGLAGQVLRGAAAPTGALLASGAAVEAGATAAGLGRVGGLAARAAAEGAAYGGATAITDAALGDHELTGERLFAAMGHGALLGGGVALGLAGVTRAASAAARGARAVVRRALGRATPAEIESIAAKQFGEAAPGLGSAVAEDEALRRAAAEAEKAPAGLAADALAAYREAVILRTGAPREVVEALFAAGAPGAMARNTAIYKAQDIADDMSRGLRGDLDAALQSYEAVASAAQGELKSAQIRRLIPQSRPEMTIGATDAAFTELRATVEAMRADSVAFGGGGRLRRLANRLEMHERAARAADEDAIRFIALDRAKREIGKESKTAMRAWSKDQRGEDLARHEALRDLYERPRVLLEDSAIWGDGAAGAQKALNAPWTEQIGGGVASPVASTAAFQRAFTVTEEGPWGRSIRFASPGKIDAYVRGLLSPTKDHAHAALRGWLANTERFVGAARDVLELSPSQLAAVERLQTAHAAALKRIDSGTTSVTLVNQAKALREFDQAGLGIAGIGGGALIAGPLGAAVGAAVGATAAPYATLKTIAATEALASRASAKLEGGASRWLHEAQRKLERMPLVAGRLAAAGGRIAEEYTTRRKRADAMADAPREVLREQAAVLAPNAPRIQAAAMATADRAAQYLSTALPAAVARGLGPPRQPSRDEMERWLRKARVIEDPASVVRDLEAGRLSRDGVDALRTVYPARYEALRQSLLDAIGEQAGSGKGLQMPYQDRLQLGLLLDLPTDATLDPELMRAVQATYTPEAEAAQQAAARPTPQKAPDVARHFADASERLEREEP